MRICKSYCFINKLITLMTFYQDFFISISFSVVFNSSLYICFACHCYNHIKQYFPTKKPMENFKFQIKVFTLEILKSSLFYKKSIYIVKTKHSWRVQKVSKTFYLLGRGIKLKASMCRFSIENSMSKGLVEKKN